MSTLNISPKLAATGTTAIPPLENGDHLTRDEFERRWNAMPELKHAELIEGVVHMPSPIRMRHHSGPRFDLISWLGFYRFATPGVLGGDNGSVRMDLENMPRPDAFLLVLPELGGQARIDDDYVRGAPELVVEVAASNVSYDVHEKLLIYLRDGAREYLVRRVEVRAFDWYLSDAGAFRAMTPDADGIHRSRVFPG